VVAIRFPFGLEARAALAALRARRHADFDSVTRMEAVPRNVRGDKT
jgi:hypothetical protein